MKLGSLRVYFGLDNVQIGSPARFAEFIARHLSRLWELETLYEERDLLRRQVAAVHEELASRKAFHRACGILARLRAVSQDEAGELLRRYAGQRGHSIQDVANALIAIHTPASPSPKTNLLRTLEPAGFHPSRLWRYQACEYQRKTA